MALHTVNLTDNSTEGEPLTLHLEADYDEGAFLSFTVSRGDDVLVDALIESGIQAEALREAVGESLRDFYKLLDSPPKAE